MRYTFAFIAVVVAIISAVPAMAHHSFSAEFDATKPLKMSGVVTKVEWMNPHVYFYIDVKDEATGKVNNWAFEMGSPNGLTGQGWTRSTMKVGMVLAVDGTRAKDGSFKGNARNVTLDGKKLGAASSQVQ